MLDGLNAGFMLLISFIAVQVLLNNEFLKQERVRVAFTKPTFDYRHPRVDRIY